MEKAHGHATARQPHIEAALSHKKTMPIIEVNHLTKEYQLGHITSLKENVFNTFWFLSRKPMQQRERFKALDEVDFTIEQGEVVGIIGHNEK